MCFHLNHRDPTLNEIIRQEGAKNKLKQITMKITEEDSILIKELADKWINIYNNNDFDFETSDEELLKIAKKFIKRDSIVICNNNDVEFNESFWWNNLKNDHLKDFGKLFRYISIENQYLNFESQIHKMDLIASIVIDFLYHKKELKKYYSIINPKFFNEKLLKCFSQIRGNYSITMLRPNKLTIRDSRGIIHNLNGPAIIDYKNEKFYYFHGEFISENRFLKLKSGEFTFEEFIQLKNEEDKSMVLGYYTEKFGNEFVYRFLSEHLKEINTYVDKKSSQYLKGTVKSTNIGVYTLFKGKIETSSEWGSTFINVAYVRCYCPSTDRIFFLSVSPYYKTAKDAIASLCRIPSKLKNDIVSIARQGEMFSFNFTENGLNILKSMKKSDFNKTVAVSGNEYFSKMKFEY
jgi:hypothetical protein